MIISAPIVDSVRAHLLDTLPGYGFDDVKVVEQVPEPRDNYFVRLSAGSDEGIADIVVDHWSLLVQCWGPITGRDRTERLSRYVAGILRDLEGHKLGASFVYEVESSAPSHSPDPDTRCPRYVSLVRITCRALIV